MIEEEEGKREGGGDDGYGQLIGLVSMPEYGRE